MCPAVGRIHECVHSGQSIGMYYIYFHGVTRLDVIMKCDKAVQDSAPQRLSCWCACMQHCVSSGRLTTLNATWKFV